MNIATLGRSCFAYAWSGRAVLLSAAAGYTLAACGPGVATPMPEPPTLRLGRIGAPFATPVLGEGSPTGGRLIQGQPGSAPPDSLLRVTNLDRSDLPVVSNVRADGGFDLSIVVNDGDELRLDWSRGSESGAPQDARFVLDPQLFHFEASTRFACLKFAPELELDFTNGDAQALAVQNDCDFDVTIATPRTRLGLTDFTLQTSLPLAIPAGGQSELLVLFTRTQSGVREDTLLVDVTGNAQLVRYPVTLSAPPAAP